MYNNNLYAGFGLDGKTVKDGVKKILPQNSGGDGTVASSSTGSDGFDAPDGDGGSDHTPGAD